jgi:hypothetical protein
VAKLLLIKQCTCNTVQAAVLFGEYLGNPIQQELDGKIRPNKTTKIDVKLTPRSFVLLKIKNVSGMEFDDTIIWSCKSNSYDGSIGKEVGRYADKYYEVPIEGESTVNLHYEITKNNQTIKKDSSFFIASYETINININY